MEIHPSLWTQLIAKLMGVQDLHQFAFHDHVISAGIVFVILTVLAIIIRSKISLVPGKLQQFVEVILENLLGMLEENMGERGRKYIPLVGTLAFFIFLCNVSGLIPSFSAATSNFNTTVACALIVFIYYHYEGIKEHRFSYVKQFMGPILAIAPLMFVIEIISHCARPFSLAVRLFGNMSGEHIVSLVFYGLIPWLVPVPLMALGLFVAFLQALIFVLLTIIYLTGAISHDH